MFWFLNAEYGEIETRNRFSKTQSVTGTSRVNNALTFVFLHHLIPDFVSATKAVLTMKQSIFPLSEQQIRLF